ncbi:hypothetical protein RFI_22407 [Reticulomyxa filosa]|uniref:Uncharacterized protein n=1 Tax=Reticulomyxa filosa TaxID=46433 RepID=X6MMT8_RETFI|nr:hypothetical protein RFI_22407 [Reticulomyxa filosa]|eukprot:ETO14961.1 hypothetical protein RFI_22407 [Reticulomyxa filosa]
MFSVYKMLTAKSVNMSLITNPNRHVHDRNKGNAIHLLDRQKFALKFIIQRERNSKLKPTNIHMNLDDMNIFLTPGGYFEVHYFLASLFYVQSLKWNEGDNVYKPSNYVTIGILINRLAIDIMSNNHVELIRQIHRESSAMLAQDEVASNSVLVSAMAAVTNGNASAITHNNNNNTTSTLFVVNSNRNTNIHSNCTANEKNNKYIYVYMYMFWCAHAQRNALRYPYLEYLETMTYRKQMDRKRLKLKKGPAQLRSVHMKTEVMKGPTKDSAVKKQKGEETTDVEGEEERTTPFTIQLPTKIKYSQKLIELIPATDNELIDFPLDWSIIDEKKNC